MHQHTILIQSVFLIVFSTRSLAANIILYHVLSLNDVSINKLGIFEKKNYG